MSKIKKEINGLLELAKCTPIEFDFQKKIQYQKLKAKTNIPRKDILRLISGLEHYQFDDEIIFWYKRLLEICVCSKEERCEIYISIMKHCNRLRKIKTPFCLDDPCTLEHDHSIRDEERDKMVLKYGQMALDMNLIQRYGDKSEHYTIITSMMRASIGFGKLQDYMNLTKEKLKIDVSRYNNGHWSSNQLLASYARLIESQIQNKCFTKALKTYKHITLFNLNSLDPKDVLASLEENGYKAHFPQSFFSIEDDETVLSTSMLELHKRHSERRISIPQKTYDIGNDEKYNDFHAYTSSIMRIGDMCTLKCMVFKGLNDLNQCKKWTRLPLLLYNDVLFEWMNMSEEINENDSKKTNQNTECNEINVFKSTKHHYTANLYGYVKKILSATLTLSVCDPSKRHELFNQLIKQIMKQEPSVQLCISTVVKESNIPFEDVTPFLEYCIDYFSKQKIDLHEKKDSIEAISFQTQQKEIVTYKNSLHIINYFEKLRGHDKLLVQNIGYSKV